MAQPEPGNQQQAPGVRDPRPEGAAVVAIGNELLSGKVKDLNVTFFIEQLRELGMPLRGVQIIPDDIDVIARAVAWAHRRFEVVFTSGGVGPTHDDVTVEAIARAFERPLERNALLAEGISRFYRGAATEEVLRMADLPAGAVLEAAEGLSVPCVRVENVWIFPGEPGILRRKFLAIRERFRREPFHNGRIRLACEEPEIAGLLAEVEGRFPRVEIGSYPSYDPERGYEVTVTVESKDAEQLAGAFDALAGSLPAEKIIESNRQIDSSSSNSNDAGRGD